MAIHRRHIKPAPTPATIRNTIGAGVSVLASDPYGQSQSPPQTFNAPGGVYHALVTGYYRIQLVGGGGGGNNIGFNGGGGGEVFDGIVHLIAGDYNVVIGAGGALDNDGGDSYVQGTTAIAHGGKKGALNYGGASGTNPGGPASAFGGPAGDATGGGGGAGASLDPGTGAGGVGAGDAIPQDDPPTIFKCVAIGGDGGRGRLLGAFGLVGGGGGGRADAHSFTDGTAIVQGSGHDGGGNSGGNGGAGTGGGGGSNASGGSGRGFISLSP